MNQQIKERWTQALRSGRYRKVTGNLRKARGFCALGVLCDLHRQEMGGTWWKRGRVFGYIYSTFTTVPPSVVYDWAGFTIDDHLERITEANDARVSFTKIAEMIDEEF